MTIDSLIQIVALIIAIYALIPRVRQLELRIQIGLLEIVVGFIYFALVCFLLFYDIFLTIGLAPEWKLEDVLGLTPDIASFPVTLLFMTFLWWRIRSTEYIAKKIYL